LFGKGSRAALISHVSEAERATGIKQEPARSKQEQVWSRREAKMIIGETRWRMPSF